MGENEASWGDLWLLFGRLATKFTCRGRCKNFVTRETGPAAPVSCSAWFGGLALRLAQIHDPTGGRTEPNWHHLPESSATEPREPVF